MGDGPALCLCNVMQDSSKKVKEKTAFPEWIHTGAGFVEIFSLASCLFPHSVEMFIMDKVTNPLSIVHSANLLY